MEILSDPRPYWTPRRRVAVERQAKRLVRHDMLGAAADLLLEAELSKRARPTVVDVAAPALGGDVR